MSDIMDTLRGYYDQSYPPSVLGVVVDPLDLSAQYAGVGTLTDFGALEASGTIGNTGTNKPTAAFTPGQYVATADGAKAHWDGTKWVPGVAPTPAPAPPPAPDDECEDDA